MIAADQVIDKPILALFVPPVRTKDDPHRGLGDLEEIVMVD